MKDPSANKARVLQQQGANKGGGKIGLFGSGFGSVSLARSGAFVSQETNVLAAGSSAAVLKP